LDRRVWKAEADGLFYVSSAYFQLDNLVEGKKRSVFKALWSLNTTSRVTIISWRLLLDKIPTKAKLAKKGVEVANRLCELCKEENETTWHLFFDCKIAKNLWYKCDNWVGISLVNHYQPNVHFQHFHIMKLINNQNTF